MRRYALIAVSLLVAVGFVTVVFSQIKRSQTMRVQFNKRDLPKQRVRIITSSDPEFDAARAGYFNDESSSEQSPLSIFILNEGTKTVIGYALVWQTVLKNGQIRTSVTRYSEPGVLMGIPKPADQRFKHQRAIEPNSVRLIALTEVSPGHSNSAIGIGSTHDELTDATDVTVSLDGVFFDDGTFVGPNTTGFFEGIQATVNAKLDLLKDVAIASENGKADEVLAQIREKGLRGDDPPPSTSTPDDYYRHYTKLFAQEIADMETVYGKNKVTEYLANLYRHPRPTIKKATSE